MSSWVWQLVETMSSSSGQQGVGLAQAHETEVGEWGVGFDELTIPELLFIVEAIQHLKLHAEAAG